MISSIRVVMFDLGDTLFYDKDPWGPIYHHANQVLIQALQDAGLHIEPSTLFHGRRGLIDFYNNLRGDDEKEETTAVVLKQLLAEQGSINVSDEVIANVLREMYKVTQANWDIEDDAVPTLQNLKMRGFRLGIISNGADDENTQTLIDKADIRSYFEFILSSGAFGLRKPHPRIFRAALDHFKIPPEQTVMIGDSLKADTYGAHQVGMKSIWITRRSVETAAEADIQPDAVVTSLSEIPPLLST